jgi:hypothetical protein
MLAMTGNWGTDCFVVLPVEFGSRKDSSQRQDIVCFLSLDGRGLR